MKGRGAEVKRSLWLIGALLLLAGGAVWAQDLPTSVAAAERHGLGKIWSFLEKLFQFSTENLREKGLRVAIVGLIGLGAKFLMDLLQTISRLMVYSEWGPLRYLFRNHQRSITLHALFISLARYVIYFTALGYILSELGIDYKTYLASLSLIGIAIGFGAQGLVQDVVTGFFILFENQFSVGDMVEISGQAGMVEAIGLRTTKIRNYYGAEITLQNRNIPMASRYPQGGFEVGVDVPLSSEAAAPQASSLLEKIGRELEKQFREIILKPPQVDGLLKLETGEVFLRLKTRIWPQQQWVIDGQLVPRIQELFKREGIEIPGDRVVSFYHFPIERERSGGFLQRFRWQTSRQGESRAR